MEHILNITIDPTFQNLMVATTSLIPLILFIIIIYRTRSGYILLKFLWDKVLRGKGSQYESIKTFDSEQYEVHRFIYHYGIKVRNLTEIEATLHWMKNKDVAMYELRRIKDRFTPKDQKIRLASAIEFAYLAVSIVLLYFITIAATKLTITNEAWYEFKQTTHSFLLGKDYAKNSDLFIPFTSDKKWELTREQCGARDAFHRAAEVGLLESEVQSICYRLTTGDDSERRADVKVQKRIGWTLLASSLYLLYLAVITIVAAKRAKALDKRINQHVNALPQSQPPTNNQDVS